MPFSLQPITVYIFLLLMLLIKKAIRNSNYQKLDDGYNFKDQSNENLTVFLLQNSSFFPVTGLFISSGIRGERYEDYTPNSALVP